MEYAREISGDKVTILTPAVVARRKRASLKLAKEITLAERAAVTWLGRVIRLRTGMNAMAARAWARDWLDAIIDNPTDPPEPDDDDRDYGSADDIYGDAEHQISYDSAMYRD